MNPKFAILLSLLSSLITSTASIGQKKSGSKMSSGRSNGSGLTIVLVWLSLTGASQIPSFRSMLEENVRSMTEYKVDSTGNKVISSYTSIDTSQLEKTLIYFTDGDTSDTSSFEVESYDEEMRCVRRVTNRSNGNSFIQNHEYNRDSISTLTIFNGDTSRSVIKISAYLGLRYIKQRYFINGTLDQIIIFKMFMKTQRIKFKERCENEGRFRKVESIINKYDKKDNLIYSRTKTYDCQELIAKSFSRMEYYNNGLLRSTFHETDFSTGGKSTFRRVYEYEFY